MANFNMNECHIGGRISSDVVLSTTQSGVSFCRFTIAVTRVDAKADANGTKPTDFVSCCAWRTTAENITKFFKKGSSIQVDGELNNNNWNDNSGITHYSMDLVVRKFRFVESKAEMESRQGQAQTSSFGQPVTANNSYSAQNGSGKPQNGNQKNNPPQGYKQAAANAYAAQAYNPNQNYVQPSNEPQAPNWEMNDDDNLPF